MIRTRVNKKAFPTNPRKEIVDGAVEVVRQEDGFIAGLAAEFPPLAVVVKSVATSQL